ncbi:MAG: TonB-dependent receptor [Ignavibacteria bacterium]|nr:TonB-dependent receptor [Ignavibacteria bacterium]
MRNKLKLYFFALFLLLLISSISHSQIKISGIVVDAKDFTPVKWVSIKAILIADSTVISATESAENGEFMIKNISPGEYVFSFESIGYTAKKIRVNLTADSKSIDTIKLFSSEYKTDVVNVEAETPEMRLDGDKKIFTTENMISTKGGTALDVLKRIPMIDVDLNDNVSLRGSTNAVILIDNKPMKFTSLRQLPANAIKDVEIITTPSAKYESEGVTGIINIVTQDKNLDFIGYHGYINGGARSNFLTGNADAGLNIKKGRFEYFLSGGYYKSTSTTDAYTRTDYNSTIDSYQSMSNIEDRFKIWYLSLGTEYLINDKNVLGVDASDNYVDYNNSNAGDSRNINSFGSTTSLLKLNIQNRVKAHNYYASIYYTGKYDKKGRELDAVVTFTGNPGDGNTETIRQRYDSLLSPISFPYDQRQTNESNYKTITLQTDYTHPFGDMTILEAGYKGSFIINENDYTADSLDYISGQFVKDYSLINHFKLNNNVNGIYTTFSHKIKDFGLKLGFRLEQTYIKGELITSEEQFKRDYLNLFPTLNLTQKIGTENQLQMSYSRRITRPYAWRYNPFVNRSDPKNISFGNPELSPELSDSYELTHSYYGKIFSLTTSIFYRRSYDVISIYSYMLDSVTTATTYRNEGSAKFYGADFILSSSILKWWTFNASLSIYISKFESSAANDYQSEAGTALKGKIRTNIKLKDIFDIEIFYNYRGKRITASGFIEPSGSLDIGINKNLFNKKLGISLRARDIFNTSDWNSEVSGVGLHTRNENKENSQAIYLNISFYFGNTKDYYEKSKETKQNDNESQDTKLK